MGQGGGAMAGMQAVGSIVGAYGQLESAKAGATSEFANAEIAENNAEIATQKAAWAGAEGVQQASNLQLKNRAQIGGIEANQGASGVEVGTGSNHDVVESAREVGMLDAMTIRSNAARQAYGYQVEAADDRVQANLMRKGAKATIKQGRINAVSTLLGGGASAVDSYGKYQNSRSAIDTGSTGGSTELLGTGY